MLVGILFVLIVFLAKTKLLNGEFNVGEQLGLMIGSSLCVVFALFYRNHYEQVMGGNPHPITCYSWLSIKAIQNYFNRCRANANAANPSNNGRNEARDDAGQCEEANDGNNNQEMLLFDL